MACRNCNNRNCKGCKKSILNRQGAIIASPLCTTDCPTDVGCESITYSGCIVYNGENLTCLDISAGNTLDEVLSAVEAKCEENAGSSNCLVKIDSTDTCCGYLYDKITSTSFTVAKSSESAACKSISINEKGWSFVGITLQNVTNPWQQSPAPDSAPRWAVRNNEVRLGGQILGGTTDITNKVLGNLPSSARPVYRLTFDYASTTGFISKIVIEPTGDIIITSVKIPGLPVGNLFISFDAIRFTKTLT